MSNPILRSYVSDIDQFLQKFDKSHPELSQSQQKEIKKYVRVYQLRDSEIRPEETKSLWEGF